ncbi:hypothetical protein D3C84_1109990 [compost metagenome]
MLGDFLDRGGVDERTDGHALIQAVTDLELADLLDQARGEAIVDAILYQDTVGAHTGLPGITELALHGSGHRLLQVGVVKHHKGRVAPQL